MVYNLDHSSVIIDSVSYKHKLTGELAKRLASNIVIAHETRYVGYSKYRSLLCVLSPITYELECYANSTKCQKDWE